MENTQRFELDSMLATWLARGNVITICTPGRARGAYRGDVCRSSVRANSGSGVYRGARW